MKTFRPIFGLLLVLILLLLACGGETALTPVGGSDSPVTDPPTTVEGDSLPADPPTSVPQATGVHELTILYTNDEHGWMEGRDPESGAAQLVGLWRDREGFDPAGSTLLLSGGDMWTGPAISTWFAGQSMVEVMNAMGYAAATIGNHEFDFGLPRLRDNARQSAFPFVTANIRNRGDNSTPTDLGLQRFVLLDVNGLAVGVTGLTTDRTPQTTKPDNVAGFTFLDYEEALREVVPEMRAAGAQLILVPGHICQDEVEALARRIDDLGVHLLGGGHCNELFATTMNGIVLLGGGSSLSSYAVARLTFDAEAGSIVDAETSFRNNIGGSTDPLVNDVVLTWQAAAAQELNVTLGYTERGVARRGPVMQDLIVESWLAAYPAADVALTNFGGMRADLPPGEITVADVIGMMPFDNVIVEVLLTGSELEEVLRGRQGNTAVGGMSWTGGQWVLDQTGAPLAPSTVYSVLVNDFMYAGGDGYRFAEFDPLGYDTSIHWRQPVIDWIAAQGSSAARPIDATLAELGE